MQKKWARNSLVAFILATCLICVACVALAEEGGNDEPLKTFATVAFKKGELEWKDPEFGEGDGMNLDFGADHELPVGTTTYVSVNAPHLMRIEDAREVTGSWTVSVELSAFKAVDGGLSSFLGQITLTNPAHNNDIVNPGELETTDPLTLVSEGSIEKVLVATPALGRGRFDTIWSDEDTILTITQGEYLKVGSGSYSADLIWTLIID